MCLDRPVRGKNCHDCDKRQEEEPSCSFHTAISISQNGWVTHWRDARLPDYLMTSKFRRTLVYKVAIRASDWLIPEGGIMAQRVQYALGVAVIALLVGAAEILATVGGGPGWGMIGNDATNSRNQPLERAIGPANVGRLAPKWV